MNFLKSIFGDPIPDAVTLVLVTMALVLVLVLIIWVIRKIVGSPALKATRGRQPRLAVTDAATLDDKRRLVLVRRDNVEHLVMIGGTSDVLIEAGIVRNTPVRKPEPAPVEQNIEEAPENTSDNTIAAVAATGVAGAAVVAASVGDATETSAAALEDVSETGNSFGDQLSELSEGLKEAVVDTPAEAPEPAAASVEDGDMDVDIEFSDLESALDESLADIGGETITAVEDATTKVAEVAAIDVSADATADAVTSDATPEPMVEPSKETKAPSVEAPKGEDMEDEMQKLLDELSGEKV